MNMSTDTSPRDNTEEALRTIAAAYPETSVAHDVVGDLVNAGLSSADVTVMSPWPVDAPLKRPIRILDHPILLALISALAMGLVAATAALLWASPDTWIAYGIIGASLGAISSSLASALTATSPPHWHDELLGDPLGAVTIEVNTTDPDSADVARQVMTSHAPALIQAQTEPGPRAPSERVLWEHEDGLSPLEELDTWVSARVSKPGSTAPRRKGRHLEADRVSRGL
jgi:hypothetical protein